MIGHACYRFGISSGAFTIFLLSPANLAGARAAHLLRPGATLPLARALRGEGGAPLADAFSFVSSLYFRGKAAYARAFARPPEAAAAGLIITPGEGLVPLDEPVTAARLEAWARVPVSARNGEFTGPLTRDVEGLERAFGATTRFVLLGSVATEKYVRPLVRVLGDHLLFPPDFVGRGDMSRGALLLRAVRERRELPYCAVEGARTSGARSARRARAGPASGASG